MNSEEQSTISNQKLDQILQLLAEMKNQIGNLDSRFTNLETRISSLETRISNLENETRQGFEHLDKRILAVEIQTKNIAALVNKAISVSYESLSVVEGTRGEVMALRAESASHGREIDRLKVA